MIAIAPHEIRIQKETSVDRMKNDETMTPRSTLVNVRSEIPHTSDIFYFFILRKQKKMK